MQPHAETSGRLLGRQSEDLLPVSWYMALHPLWETWQITERQQIVTVLNADGMLTLIAPRLQDACRSETIRAVSTNSATIYPVAIVCGRNLKNV